MRQRTALIFSAGLFLIAIASFFVFVYNDSGKKEGDIVLPSGSTQIEEAKDIAQRNEREIAAVTVTKDNVKEVIKSLSRPKEYTFKAEVIYYYDYEASEFYSTIHSKDELTSITLEDENSEKRVILTPNHIYSWGENAENYYKGPRGDIYVEDEARIPTYESLLKVPDEDILSAEVRMHNGGIYLYAETQYDGGKYMRTWYIDVVSGLLFGCDTKENGTVIYRMTRTELRIEPQSSDLFMLPSGVMPEGYEIKE